MCDTFSTLGQLLCVEAWHLYELVHPTLALPLTPVPSTPPTQEIKT